MNSEGFKNFLRAAKERLLQLHFESQTGHVGTNLSCIDAMMVLHHAVMKEEDRFVLSKGHAAAAWYTTLWSMGRISEEVLRTFAKDNSVLPGHPSGAAIPGLMFPTGSLGHGPSLASGLALAAKFRQSSSNVYCLCSDGEWQEGSCWEALIFARHQQLDNLTIMIDQNRLQGFGSTQDVISCQDLRARLLGFGVEVLACNGHEPSEVFRALQTRPSGGPQVLLLETQKGKGTLYQGKMESHYLPLTEENYRFALMNLRSSC
jgi:transketolase